jgi:hypothetical protein
MEHEISLPDEIEQLAEAVVGGIDCSDCYVEKEGGGFVLSENAKQQIAACNEDLTEREAEAKAKLAERDAKIMRLEGTVRELATSSAIRAALFRCGVSAKLTGMALPYLQKTLTIEIDDSGAPTVCGPYGRQSVESAVAAWLASPEGERFAPKQPTGGGFASAIRRMRAH